MDTRRTDPLIWLQGRQMGKCRAQRIDCIALHGRSSTIKIKKVIT